MVDFSGWEMPQQYRTVKDEHRAVRTAAGLFDVSHMGRFEMRGAGAAGFLQGLVTNDLTRLQADRAQYNLLCRPDGVCCPLSAGKAPFRALHGRPAAELMRDAAGPLVLEALDGDPRADLLVLGVLAGAFAGQLG